MTSASAGSHPYGTSAFFCPKMQWALSSSQCSVIHPIGAVASKCKRTNPMHSQGQERVGTNSLAYKPAPPGLPF